ncbi:hypothetical protein [Allonocardiopsis opalescens]|uniref:Uncharacterized protein n=1 Tax=Allonocardiopsis opalescens TaxID=1144618 RepID=A0A2T0QC73_9ACTN|nr:hypothetical protein [Allonocardiopsis opalescens]PRY01505.1 hypothetical protein CLV72_10187 [Allonocardiopsis opalescens]
MSGIDWSGGSGGTAVDPAGAEARERLASVDRLREVCDDFRAALPADRLRALRARSLRRHAAEVGVLDGLVRVDREAAQRFAADGLEAAGLAEPDRSALAAVHRAVDAAADACRTGERLGPEMLAELYRSFPGTSAQQPAERLRPVAELAERLAGRHPLVQAAGVHHAALRSLDGLPAAHCTAWALATFTALQARYAPLAADRAAGAEHARALRAADRGDPGRLVELFARIQEAGLRAELAAPGPADRSRPVRGASVAAALHRRLAAEVEAHRNGLADVFQEIDTGCGASVVSGAPPDPRSGWWRRQLDHAAARAAFQPGDDSWWVRLQLSVGAATLRYLVAIQQVGDGRTGVFAVTAHAEAVGERAGRAPGEPLLDLSPVDCVTLIHTDTVGERAAAVERFAGDTLSAAVDGFARRL